MKLVDARRPLTALVLSALSLWCSGAAWGAEAPQPVSGTASWFGERHHGKNTASGEPFDMYAMTAAHKRLPFGTVLRVTNQENGNVVLVRVNDRGPYRKRRILDLSYAAADRLNMHADGTAPVRIEVVGTTDGLPLDDSQAFFVRLEGGKPACAEHVALLTRVGVEAAPSLLRDLDGAAVLGPYHTFDAAEEMMVRITTTYPQCVIVLGAKDTPCPPTGLQPVPEVAPPPPVGGSTAPAY